MAEGGYDTTNFIGVVYSAADSKYGAPKYWIRYFSPAPNTPINVSSSNANAECRADWDSTAKHLSPITSPSQGRLNGTSAEGLADAQTFVSALTSVYFEVIPLEKPTNDILYCWLYQESSTVMSTAYWSGWSGYVNSYRWIDGTYPLYACLYCNPCGGAGHNCTTISVQGGCFQVWSSEPESGYCGYTLKNLPTWHANTCSKCASAAPGTHLWQFAEQGYCGLTVDIDMDEGTMTPYSFYLTAKP